MPESPEGQASAPASAQSPSVPPPRDPSPGVRNPRGPDGSRRSRARCVSRLARRDQRTARAVLRARALAALARAPASREGARRAWRIRWQRGDGRVAQRVSRVGALEELRSRRCRRPGHGGVPQRVSAHARRRGLRIGSRALLGAWRAPALRFAGSVDSDGRPVQRAQRAVLRHQGVQRPADRGVLTAGGGVPCG